MATEERDDADVLSEVPEIDFDLRARRLFLSTRTRGGAEKTVVSAQTAPRTLMYILAKHVPSEVTIGDPWWMGGSYDLPFGKDKDQQQEDLRRTLAKMRSTWSSATIAHTAVEDRLQKDDVWKLVVDAINMAVSLMSMDFGEETGADVLLRVFPMSMCVAVFDTFGGKVSKNRTEDTLFLNRSGEESYTAPGAVAKWVVETIRGSLEDKPPEVAVSVLEEALLYEPDETFNSDMFLVFQQLLLDPVYLFGLFGKSLSPEEAGKVQEVAAFCILMTFDWNNVVGWVGAFHHADKEWQNLVKHAGNERPVVGLIVAILASFLLNAETRAPGSGDITTSAVAAEAVDIDVVPYLEVQSLPFMLGQVCAAGRENKKALVAAMYRCATIPSGSILAAWLRACGVYDALVAIYPGEELTAVGITTNKSGTKLQAHTKQDQVKWFWEDVQRVEVLKTIFRADAATPQGLLKDFPETVTELELGTLDTEAWQFLDESSPFDNLVKFFEGETRFPEKIATYFMDVLQDAKMVLLSQKGRTELEKDSDFTFSPPKGNWMTPEGRRELNISLRKTLLRQITSLITDDETTKFREAVKGRVKFAAALWEGRSAVDQALAKQQDSRRGLAMSLGFMSAPRMTPAPATALVTFENEDEGRQFVLRSSQGTVLDDSWGTAELTQDLNAFMNDQTSAAKPQKFMPLEHIAVALMNVSATGKTVDEIVQFLRERVTGDEDTIRRLVKARFETASEMAGVSVRPRKEWEAGAAGTSRPRAQGDAKLSERVEAVVRKMREARESQDGARFTPQVGQRLGDVIRFLQVAFISNAYDLKVAAKGLVPSLTRELKTDGKRRKVSSRVIDDKALASKTLQSLFSESRSGSSSTASGSSAVMESSEGGGTFGLVSAGGLLSSSVVVSDRKATDRNKYNFFLETDAGESIPVRTAGDVKKHLTRVTGTSEASSVATELVDKRSGKALTVAEALRFAASAGDNDRVQYRTSIDAEILRAILAKQTDVALNTTSRVTPMTGVLVINDPKHEIAKLRGDERLAVVMETLRVAGEQGTTDPKRALAGASNVIVVTLAELLYNLNLTDFVKQEVADTLKEIQRRAAEDAKRAEREADLRRDLEKAGIDPDAWLRERAKESAAQEKAALEAGAKDVRRTRPSNAPTLVSVRPSQVFRTENGVRVGDDEDLEDDDDAGSVLSGKSGASENPMAPVRREDALGVVTAADDGAEAARTAWEEGSVVQAVEPVREGAFRRVFCVPASVHVPTSAGSTMELDATTFTNLLRTQGIPVTGDPAFASYAIVSDNVEAHHPGLVQKIRGATPINFSDFVRRFGFDPYTLSTRRQERADTASSGRRRRSARVSKADIERFTTATEAEPYEAGEARETSTRTRRKKRTVSRAYSGPMDPETRRASQAVRKQAKKRSEEAAAKILAAGTGESAIGLLENAATATAGAVKQAKRKARRSSSRRSAASRASDAGSTSSSKSRKRRSTRASRTSSARPRTRAQSRGIRKSAGRFLESTAESFLSATSGAGLSVDSVATSHDSFPE
jgi:hypothetical protein